MNPNKKNAENAEIFNCLICDFKCSKKSNYNIHLMTRKHKILTNPNDLMPLSAYDKHLSCKCGKKYSHLSSLCAHRKKCTYIEKNNINIHIGHSDLEDIEHDNENNNDDNHNHNVHDNTENMIISTTTATTTTKPPEKTTEEFKMLTTLVMEVVKNNQDFQKQMFEMCKTIQSNITMNNNCNNTFNMQVFLNEECKDAINITDFVNSVNIQLEDVENVGRLGYANGISNIIVKELKMLDVYKRPIHCSDVKREIFYVKDNDVWERETPENSKLIKAIQGISKKNMVKLNDWRDKYPDCMDCESQYNDIYIKLMLEACGGRGDQSAGENKIIKNIAKEVVINKKP